MVNIYVDSNTPRLTYVLDYIFQYRLNVSYTLYTDYQLFKTISGAKLLYTSFYQDVSHLYIPPSGILRENGLSTPNPDVLVNHDIVKMYRSDDLNEDIDFDVLGAIFFMLSRYEEYQNTPTDPHGRQLGSSSIAYKFSFISRPVVDEWVHYLAGKLDQYYPELQCKRNTLYQVQLTVDVDRAYAYTNRSISENVLGGGKSILQGNLKTAKTRWSTLLGTNKDPYDTYAKLISKVRTPVLWFFLVRKKLPYDNAVGLDNGSLATLIKDLNQDHPIGIHPSVTSHKEGRLLNEEIHLLESIIEKAVSKSRQHYLKIKLPTTYESLITSGITDDYSMGYHDELGFRAGTSLPYLWYNLGQEEPTNLCIHPFAIMDVTLKKYLNLTPKEAIDQCKNIIQNIKAVGGNCSIIWHNSSFYAEEGWQNWERVLDYVLSSND